MSASTWFAIGIAGFTLAGLLFIISVFMFFKMNIPAIIGELSGKTAAKQIVEIRAGKVDTGLERRHTASKFSPQLESVVDLAFEETGGEGSEETERLENNTDILTEENATQLLMEDEMFFSEGSLYQSTDSAYNSSDQVAFVKNEIVVHTEETI